MKITALVENTSDGVLKAKHGLSLYIETAGHKILFDLGPDKTVFANAEKIGVDLKAVDTVIISHGHFDHGGPLKDFLAINTKAKVYIQRTAYEPHYSKAGLLKINIGIDKSTAGNPNVVLLDGDYKIDDELSLFVSKAEDKLKSDANKALFKADGPDDFRHEQNLLIHSEKDVLFTGCAHSGVVSILESAPARPAYCIGGFHVYNPVNRKTVPVNQLEFLSQSLNDYSDIIFYTCHCTGKKAFDYLSAAHANIKYISAGNVLEI
ncbi:MAG: MBL fold metallo-hydrolase [Clostridia bacterium]|nr:MBL fold metallo-hydrolase [Clostridia bacterium]